MLTDLIPPAVMAQITAVFKMAGKDKDEHFDLKSELLNNLGDDIISYEKAPKAVKLSDLRSAPTLYLIGSPNPEKLAGAFKVILSMPCKASLSRTVNFSAKNLYRYSPGGCHSNG